MVTWRQLAIICFYQQPVVSPALRVELEALVQCPMTTQGAVYSANTTTFYFYSFKSKCEMNGWLNFSACTFADPPY